MIEAAYKTVASITLILLIIPRSTRHHSGESRHLVANGAGTKSASWGVMHAKRSLPKRSAKTP